MTTSAITSVNGDASHLAHIVTYGTIVQLALVSIVNVRTVSLKFISDNLGSTSFPTITNGWEFGRALFTMPADPSTGAGWGFLLETIVNESTSTQSIFRCIVGATNSGGVVPVCPDESLERNPTLGWLEAFYQLVATAGGGIGALGAGNVIIGSALGNQIRHLTIADIDIAGATFTPSAHASTHLVGGSDALPVSSTTVPGLMPAKGTSAGYAHTDGAGGFTWQLSPNTPWDVGIDSFVPSLIVPGTGIAFVCSDDGQPLTVSPNLPELMWSAWSDSAVGDGTSYFLNTIILNDSSRANSLYLFNIEVEALVRVSGAGEFDTSASRLYSKVSYVVSFDNVGDPESSDKLTPVLPATDTTETSGALINDPFLSLSLSTSDPDLSIHKNPTESQTWTVSWRYRLATIKKLASI